MNNSTFTSEFHSFLATLPKARFDRGKIIDILQNLTSANPSLLNNPLIFYRDPITGVLHNNVTGSPIITIDVCTAISGTGLFNLYVGASARLLTWLSPTLLLMTGMQYAPIGWRKFAMVPHLLSDPIDSARSLLSKVETWNRCLAMAKKLSVDDWVSEREYNVGLIIACIEELFRGVRDVATAKSEDRGEDVPPRLEFNPGDSSGWSAEVDEDIQTKGREEGNIASKDMTSTTKEVMDPKADPEKQLVFTIENTPFCACTHGSLDTLYSEIACSIHENRVSGVRQTIFSICAYIVLGIVAAFVPDFGGNPNPSGGKIVAFILLSWLLPEILLSNIVGQFNTAQFCLNTIKTFKTDLARLMKEESGLHHGGCDGRRAREWIEMMDKEEWETYPETLAETGSIYSFRLSKRYPVLEPPSLITGNSELATNADWKLVVVSILPVCTSFTAAFIVLWSAPTYFSCRHVMIISIFTSWILSFLITTFLPRSSRSIKTTFNIIIAKDTILASAILGILISSACGLFNSCFCWSGWWYLRYSTKEPQIQLDPSAQFQKNVRWIYPVVVGLMLGAQLVWFLGMLWVGRDVYFGMMRWSEERVWRVVLGPKRKGVSEEEGRGLLRGEFSS